MFYLNKLVGWLISPLSVALVVLLAGLVFVWQGKRRLGLWPIAGAVACLWLWATPIMTCVVGCPLEKEFLAEGRVLSVESFPNVDAIVVLGGGMGKEESLSPYAEMWTSADRVWQSARLWKAGKAPKIVATGDGAKESTLGLLVEMGVKAECVEFIGARNTEEEARGIGACLNVGMGECENVKAGKCGNGALGKSECGNGSKTNGIKRILLVTSAWHMKRARLMFEKYASEIEVICAPADFEMSMMAKKGVGVLGLLPDANALCLNSVALHEWVGLVGYRLFR